MMTGKNDDAAATREDSFLGGLVPQVAEHLAERHALDFDTEAGQARFLAWLAAHTQGPASPAKDRAGHSTGRPKDWPEPGSPAPRRRVRAAQGQAGHGPARARPPVTPPGSGTAPRRTRVAARASAVKHSNSVIRTATGSRTAKLAISSATALLALVVSIATVAHLGGSKPHAAITAAAVTTKLIEIEQVDVATKTYTVNVTITQSVGAIPCWMICNQMQLDGVGSDEAILDLSMLSSSNVEVNAARSSVTLWIPAPTIGPADLDPAKSDISSSHGIVSSLTMGIRNNPNGYQPLFAAAEKKIHDQAEHDPELLAEAEQNTRELITRLLGAVGVHHVTVNFI
jgi:Protein of unknown function (DUF4230)